MRINRTGNEVRLFRVEVAEVSATYIYNPSKTPFTAINRRDCLRASAKVASDLCTRLLQQLIRRANNSKKQCGAIFLMSVEVAD